MMLRYLLAFFLTAALLFTPQAKLAAGPFANRHIAALTGVSAPILPALDLQFANGEALDALVTFTRASAAFNHNSVGTLVEIPSGTARVNSYLYDGANWINHGFLREESRLSSLFPNQDLTGTWVNINTDEPTTNNADPTGGTSAVEVAATSTADQQFAIYRSFTGLTAGHSTAISAFINAGTNATFAQLVWDSDGGGTDGAFCNFNLSTGASGSITAFAAGTATDCGVVDLGGGFYRLWIIAEIDAGTVGRLTIGIIDRIDAVGFEAANLADNDSIIPWGIQVEINTTFITSYMGETTSGTITRARDVAEVTDMSWLNQTKGTFQFIGTLLPRTINKNYSLFSIFADSSNYIWMFDRGASDEFIVRINKGGVLQAITENWTTQLVDGKEFTVASAWETNDFATYWSGESKTGNTGEVPGAAVILDLSDSPFANGQTNSHIKSLKYWPVRLDNGYLAARSIQ